MQDAWDEKFDLCSLLLYYVTIVVLEHSGEPLYGKKRSIEKPVKLLVEHASCVGIRYPLDHFVTFWLNDSLEIVDSVLAVFVVGLISYSRTLC